MKTGDPRGRLTIGLGQVKIPFAKGARRTHGPLARHADVLLTHSAACQSDAFNAMEPVPSPASQPISPAEDVRHPRLIQTQRRRTAPDRQDRAKITTL
ncbi:hypothetical protein AAFF_G00278880 [Aldrovandia affinis]|uniref:Uncharacterized protein n=1 Tax=Aldrovandia affinis TaxID=143900 RepID=A0AAD7SR50_9TELE|nr:hypothetical protein AAFF_G00278880 [Aldrovandia affinis]